MIFGLELEFFAFNHALPSQRLLPDAEAIFLDASTGAGGRGVCVVHWGPFHVGTSAVVADQVLGVVRGTLKSDVATSDLLCFSPHNLETQQILVISAIFLFASLM